MENSDQKQHGENVTPPTNEPEAPAEPPAQAELTGSTQNSLPQHNNKNQEEQQTSDGANENGSSISESVQNQLNIQDMELTELRVKLICLEKNNMALKLELKSAELQLEAKSKVDEKKSRLIELLDAKVQDLQKKKVHLMEMLETLLKEKDTHSHRLIDATKNMEELAAKLADSEKMKNELRSMNLELKKMLGSLEDKGTQIAKVAKEKLLKYKEDSIKMQQQLDDLKKITTPKEGEAANEEQQSHRLQKYWKSIEDLQQQLIDALQGEGVAEKVMGINELLKRELAELQLEFNALLHDNEKLRNSLDSLRLVITELQNLNKDCKMTPEQLSKDAPAAALVETNAAKDQEAAQLQERLNQLCSAIEKLADLSALVSSK